MPNDQEKPGTITDAAKAIAAITEQVPIYQDAIQPGAKEVGKGLVVVAKAVNAALIPVEGFIWGMEKIRDFVSAKVTKKLQNVPPEDIQPLKPHIGVPAIEALRYTGEESDLADLYANLLATAMDRKTAYTAHPGFVDIIKNMAPDEARIMRYLSANTFYPLINIKLVTISNSVFTIPFRHISLLGLDAQCQHPPLAATYIDNLERLGLIEVSETSRMSNEEVYKRIEDFPQIKDIVESMGKDPDKKPEVEKIRLLVTDLGKQFIGACVIDKELQKRG
jgi:hypothetical protein